MWPVLILMCVGMGLTLLAVFVGGWLVFKAKTITMPTPFMQLPKKKDEGPFTYASDLFNGDDATIINDELSPAAARLRGQKDQVLSAVKGGKP